MKTNKGSWWPDVLSIEKKKKKTQNVSEIIVYNLSQQKRFFVDVTLKSSMAHYRLMTFGYFATFSSSKQHPNSYLVAQKVSVIAIFLGRNGHLRKKTKWRHTVHLSVAKGLKLPDLILSLLWLLKTHRGFMNSVTFKFWVTLEFARRHGNLKPKCFDFCIEYKPVDRRVHFIITDWNYLVFWKKLALNQVLRF